MPGKTFNSTSYRYGFNTQEKDNEISGNGNSYTAEFWQYDSRLGRRWNLDTRPNHFASNYVTFDNNPIFWVDLKGDTSSFYDNKTGELLETIDDGNSQNHYSVDAVRYKGFKNKYEANELKAGRNADFLSDPSRAKTFVEGFLSGEDIAGQLDNKSYYNKISFTKETFIATLQAPNADGTMGMGHMSTLIGNDDEGWIYFSKGGVDTDAPGGCGKFCGETKEGEQKYKSLNKFLMDDSEWRARYSHIAIYSLPNSVNSIETLSVALSC